MENENVMSITINVPIFGEDYSVFVEMINIIFNESNINMERVSGLLDIPNWDRSVENIDIVFNEFREIAKMLNSSGVPVNCRVDEGMDNVSMELMCVFLIEYLNKDLLERTIFDLKMGGIF